MKLTEAQSKDLLGAFGISVPLSRLVNSLDELSAAFSQLPPPVYLKAQVPLKDRATKGLVVLCNSVAEGMDWGSKLLGSALGRYKVEAVLVEQPVDAADLLYVGVTIDPATRSPVLLVSRGGGTGIERRGRPFVFPLSVLEPIPPWLGRHAATCVGYRGTHAVSLGKVILALVRAFYDLDATLLEINPLALSGGDWIALDARIEVDDDALYRQPRVPKDDGVSKTAIEAAAEEIDRSDSRGVAGRLVEFDGDLALLIGGGGASLTIFDAVLNAGLRPANYCEIGGNPTVRKVAALTELLLRKPGVRHLAVIMNVVSNTRADLIARGAIKGILSAGRDPKSTLVAFRVPGSWEEEARLLLSRYGIETMGREMALDVVVDLIAARIDGREAFKC